MEKVITEGYSIEQLIEMSLQGMDVKIDGCFTPAHLVLADKQ